MDWINVNEKYLDYLRGVEGRIPYTDYGNDKYKPFFGSLFEIGDLCYITQISHPQPRHLNMKNQPDFFKIYDIKNSTRLIAVVNLNYMFPIPKKDISPFIIKDIDKYRSFVSEEEKSKYISLLKTEMKAIKKLDLEGAAKRLYDKKISFPDSYIAKRCLDYRFLETYALSWRESI